MNKRILFLYFNKVQKAELVLCEKIFKALFRKFRTSVLFNYLQLDASPSCRDLMYARFSEEAVRNDAIFLCGGSGISSEESEFLESLTKMYAVHHQNAGISIFFPCEKRRFSTNNGSIEETVSYDMEAIRKSIELCADYAKENRKTVNICTEDYGAGKFMFEEFEKIQSDCRHLDIRHMTHMEMVQHCSRYISQPCAVFAQKSFAELVLMHTFTAQNLPNGYTVFHTACGRIYKELVSPFLYEQCHSLRMMVLAFAALIEKEFAMKNPAFRLRLCITSAFSGYNYATKEELALQTISEINKPMRKRNI